MRKNWKMRISADSRGKISTGMKTTSKAGKEIPKSLDYFNISKFPELVEVYGEKPNTLYIVFPSDNIDTFFQTEFVLWAKKGEGKAWKKRSCNGEICTHHLPETINKVKYERGDTHECFGCGTNDATIGVDDHCRCFTGFSSYVLDPKTGRVIIYRPYRFQTNSVNSSDNILSELYKIFEQYGGVPKIPFQLMVKMQETQTKDGKKNIYPLWDCQVYGTVDQINQLASRLQLPTNETNALSMVDESKLIGAPPTSSTVGSQAQTGVESPIDEAEEVIEPENMPEVEEKQQPDDSGSDEHEPKKTEKDILDRVGVLAYAAEDDMGDEIQMVGTIAKIAMELAGNDKTKARAILKKHSKNPSTMHSGYDSTLELKKAEIVFLRGVLAKIKKTYRDELIKAEVAVRQGSVV